MDRAETGRTGEAVAARYYQKQGCELVAHNYRTRMGEIDLILRELDGTLVLCEVKTRSPDPLAAPAAAVTPAKQRRLIRTAEYYLQHTGQSDEPVRFDVAEVTPLDSGRWMVHIIKGAFYRVMRGASVGKGRKRLLPLPQTWGQCGAPLAKRSDDNAVFQHERS